MDNSSIRLDGKKILITGVSRPRGIGATLAKRFAESGAIVAVHGFSDYDLTVGEHNSAMPDGTEIIAKQLNVTLVTPSDFAKTGTAVKVVDEAAEKLGGLDGLILNHCYGTTAEIGTWTEEDITPHLLINIRASMMMIQSFVNQVDTTKDNAITLFTSGQYLSPMKNEIAYCVSKEAVICLCRQSAWELGDKNIRVNCINPGANDTGYCFGEVYESVAKRHPSGRWGTPDDAADLALFLHSNYAKWITGQVIASDGGIRENWYYKYYNGGINNERLQN
ncbi:MAG: SDR family oxidoreductase [Oscillospiraceae bacterium]|nr:SDR family oxidoreductase [Oscillospiraceae bacterium]